MNKYIRFFPFIFALMLTAHTLTAQPPPRPSGDPSEDGGPVGSGPVGSGLGILLALGAAYGAKKVYDARRRLSE
jgi:hypothetical protein